MASPRRGESAFSPRREDFFFFGIDKPHIYMYNRRDFGNSDFGTEMETEMTTTKKQWIEKAVIVLALIVIFALFFFFLRDILVPFLKMEIDHDLHGARRLLREKGVMGFFAVTLVEALQMVVIFIPAEFIQISSGLSYPFPVALLLCDLGVCLGATIIFVLVRTFRFNNQAYEKSRKRIEQFSAASKKERSVILLLFFLFFMPLIPFGAICYYGSGTKIRYGPYILTVAVGVIPSIVVSNLMGAAGKAFFAKSLPIGLLILIIVLLAALLFAIIFLFLDRIYFRENSGTPDSVIQVAFFKLVRLLRGKKQTVCVDALPSDIRSPYILLSNHESFYDFYYVSLIDPDHRPSFVVNRYYLTRPIVRRLWKKSGMIPKRLFVPDTGTTVGVIRMIRHGYPVILFPEGRLSPDGRSNPILQEAAALYRKLNIDLVLVNISGAYFAKPKWRKRFFRSEIAVKVARVIRKEEISQMTDAELNALIAKTLFRDASENQTNLYPQKNKAEGLEKILYRCIDCGALYTTVGKGNTLSCSRCGAAHTLNEHYRFEGLSQSISAYYQQIEWLEERELDTLSLQSRVRIKVFGADGKVEKRECGECSLTPSEFCYRSDTETFSIPTEQLPALPFSCGEEFELYYQNRLYYFYPQEQRQQVARWALAVDLLTKARKKRMNFGKASENGT